MKDQKKAFQTHIYREIHPKQIHQIWSNLEMNILQIGKILREFISKMDSFLEQIPKQTKHNDN